MRVIDFSKFNIPFPEGFGTAPSGALYSKSLGEQRFSGVIGVEPLKKFNGADSRIRTDDLLITNELLYQLSYTSPQVIF